MSSRPFALLRRVAALAMVAPCLFLLLAVATALDRRSLVSRSLDSQPPATPELRNDEAIHSRAALPHYEATSDGEELAVDDGSPDGRGLLQDGLTMAVRLTPLSYPARLTAIRIYFVKFTDAPDPAGKSIRLVAFTAPGAPYLIDRQVQVPQTGGYVDFAIPEKPEIREGDLYVGYQAPNPASGVGFATDTSGVQADRTFWLDNGATKWSGPLAFTDGIKANALIRARISTSLPDSGDFELRTDDSSLEGGFLRDGGLYVNRLTPPKYPVTLKKIRIYVPRMTDQPSAEGQTVKVIAFRDPSGSGSPPSALKLDIQQSTKLGKVREFTEIAVDGPVIASGDIYVGFEAPDPHQGVAFPVDTTGQPSQRVFRSRDGGKTFSGPIEITGDASQNGPVNLMVRAVVSFGQPAARANHAIETSAAEIDLGEGGSESLKVVIAAPSRDAVYDLKARFDPPAPGLTAELSQQQARAQDVVAVKISSAGPGDVTSAQLVLEAADSDTTARTTVPVYLWRELASASIGPTGGSVEAPDVAVQIPPAAFSQPRTIRLLTGKPVTGREDSLASPVFRIDGLPDSYKGGLQVRMPAAPKASASRSAVPEGSVAVLQLALPNATGKTLPVQVFQPTTAQNGTVVLNCPPNKLTVTRNFSLWMLAGWLSMTSEHGNFLIFYPVTARDTAIYVAGLMEKALANLSGPDVDIRLLERISHFSTLGNLGFTTHPIRVTLDATLASNGITRAGQIYLDLKVLKDEPGRTDNRATPGHELMHIAQNLYGSEQGTVDWWAGRADPRVWADDAQATWFEPVAVAEPGLIPGNMEACARDFLLAGPLAIPGNYAGDRDYGYGASAFLAYLTRFVDKTIPSRWLAQRAPDREPWALLKPLMGGETALAGHWRDFGEKLFTKSLLPNPAYPDPVSLMPLADADTFQFMKPAETEDKKWRQAHDLSMRFYSLLIPNGIPALTDSAVLGFKVLEKYPDVDLYVMGLKSRKLISRLRGPGELTVDRTEVSGETGLLVAAVNYSYDFSPTIRSRRDITIRMGLAEPTVKVQGYIGGDRVIGATYNFTTENRNIPADASYTWEFGNGKPVMTRAATASWNQAGTYKVRVEVKFGSRTVTDEMSVTVAPDKPPAAKAEVLFDVYRRIKNSFGTSNQRCNDYAVSIYDPSGTYLDGGSSVARNGAFDITLPVANGYSYRIRYTYTIPCPDSGTASGRFDVRANTVNGVKVETTPCEQ